MKDLHRRYLDTEVFDHSIIDVVFENTPPHAPLKYYLTAVAASLVKESEVKLYKDVHSMEFWLQLTEELVRLADHKHTRGGQWRERAEQVAKISVDEYLFA